jgi:hypothetical protein
MAEEHIDTAGRRRIKEDLRVVYMSGEVPHRLSLAHLHVAIGCGTYSPYSSASLPDTSGIGEGGVLIYIVRSGASIQAPRH